MAGEAGAEVFTLNGEIGLASLGESSASSESLGFLEGIRMTQGARPQGVAGVVNGTEGRPAWGAGRLLTG